MLGAFSGINAGAQNVPAIEVPSLLAAPQSADFESAITSYAAGDALRALVIAERHAKEGNTEAQVMAGHIYLRGETGLVDYDRALKYFKMAASFGDTDGYMALGEMSLRSQAGLTPPDAMEWFSKAAQQGRKDAKRAIGEMFLKGTGTAQDTAKGQDWLQQAVDLGDARAMRLLADSYFESDAPQALGLYERAASYGDTDAAYIAAIMLAENLDVKPDSAKQAKLLKQAAEAGHAAAQADYGLLVYQGVGTEQSLTQAAEWFEKSAKGGDSEGQFLYAFTLAKGEGVKRSFEDAYYWLLKSGESDVDEYQNDRKMLKERLEANVDLALLKRARIRFEN